MNKQGNSIYFPSSIPITSFTYSNRYFYVAYKVSHIKDSRVNALALMNRSQPLILVTALLFMRSRKGVVYGR
jgi:hypothetical protein